VLVVMVTLEMEYFAGEVVDRLLSAVAEGTGQLEGVM
jgi:hypothetical protein